MRCCICGTIRNCEMYLNKIFKNMELIGSLFEDYRIILYYDKSNDNSLNKIIDYSKKNPKLLYHNNKSPLLEFRTHRIALGRNYCLNIIRENFSDYEYFIMMDCDDKCARNLKLNLLKYYLSRKDWDSLSFNYPLRYYDSWAISKIPYVLSCHHFNCSNKWTKYIVDIIKKTPKHELIKCISAFNGFAIYRTNKFLNCYYDGRFRLDYIPKHLINLNIKYAGNIDLSQKNQDCEHRHFHFEAFFKNGARIRISPLCFFI